MKKIIMVEVWERFSLLRFHESSMQLSVVWSRYYIAMTIYDILYHKYDIL